MPSASATIRSTPAAGNARTGGGSRACQDVGVVQGEGEQAADRDFHPVMIVNFFGTGREGFIHAEVGQGSLQAPRAAAIADAAGRTKWAPRLRPAAPKLFGELNPAERDLPTDFFTRGGNLPVAAGCTFA